MWSNGIEQPASRKVCGSNSIMTNNYSRLSRCDFILLALTQMFLKEM